MIDRFSIWLERVGERRVLIVIAIVSFAVQLLAIRAPEIYGEPYLIAKNIIAGKGYVFAYPLTNALRQTCYIPPLYTFLQVPFLYFGLGERGIQVMNLFFLQAACFFIYRFFRQFVTSGTSLLIFVAVSFYIPFWVLTYSLEPNSLNILLLVLTVDRLYHITKEPSRKIWLQLGVLLGIQLWLRPDILLGFAFFAVWLLLFAKQKTSDKIKGLALASAVGLLMISPWTIRNYLLFHRFVLVSANSGMNLYIGNNYVATGELNSLSPTPESRREYNDILAYANTHDQVEVDQYRLHLAEQWMLEHPGEVFALDLKKFMYHWFGRDEIGMQYHYNYGVLKGLYRSITILLIGLGLFGLVRLKDRELKTLIITVFLYSTSVSTIFFVQTRHRALKVDPFLVSLAVIGVASLVQPAWKKARERKHSEATIILTEII